MRLLFRIFGIIVISGFPASQGLSCYTFDYYNTDANSYDPQETSSTFLKQSKIRNDCFSCKKLFTKTAMSSNVPVVESWQCENVTAGGGPCRESVYVSYSADGVASDSRTCTCCSDLCNDANYCNDQNPSQISDLKALLNNLPSRVSSAYQPNSCYNLTSTNSYGTGNQGQDISFSRSAGSTDKICYGCKKTYTRMALAGGSSTDEVWGCNDTAVSASSTCVPQISGHIYFDGSLVSLQCSCCTDGCNDANFCKLPSTGTNPQAVPNAFPVPATPGPGFNNNNRNPQNPSPYVPPAMMGIPGYTSYMNQPSRRMPEWMRLLQIYSQQQNWPVRNRTLLTASDYFLKYPTDSAIRCSNTYQLSIFTLILTLGISQIP